MTQIPFGKIIKEESYFNGRIKSTKLSYSVPELITDKNSALSELMKALDLITTGQTHHLTLVVEADPLTHKFKLITKSYVMETK